MITKQQYVAYLVSTPITYSCSNLAEHLEGVSHDAVTDYLERERHTARQLWELAQLLIDDSPSAFLILDDSGQATRSSRKIELVKRQYSGNEHGIVSGIGVVNLLHSAGADADFYPIDYRTDVSLCQVPDAMDPGDLLARRCGTRIGSRRGGVVDWRMAAPGAVPHRQASRAPAPQTPPPFLHSPPHPSSRYEPRVSSVWCRRYVPPCPKRCDGGSRSTVLGPFATVVNSTPMPSRSSCVRTNCGTDCPSGR